MTLQAINVPYRPIRVPYSATEAPYCAIGYTVKLSIYSQGGNILFPGWEYFVPNVGIIVNLFEQNFLVGRGLVELK